MHETLSEHSYTDVSESERKIFNKTLSQKNSADVPESNIMGLKDKEYK